MISLYLPSEFDIGRSILNYIEQGYKNARNMGARMCYQASAYYINQASITYDRTSEIHLMAALLSARLLIAVSREKRKKERKSSSVKLKAYVCISIAARAAAPPRKVHQRLGSSLNLKPRLKIPEMRDRLTITRKRGNCERIAT